MASTGDMANATSLLRQGRSDEDVERLAGLTLLKVVELRASLAGATRRGPLFEAGAGPSSKG